MQARRLQFSLEFTADKTDAAYFTPPLQNTDLEGTILTCEGVSYELKKIQCGHDLLIINTTAEDFRGTHLDIIAHSRCHDCNAEMPDLTLRVPYASANLNEEGVAAAVHKVVEHLRSIKA